MEKGGGDYRIIPLLDFYPFPPPELILGEKRREGERICRERGDQGFWNLDAIRGGEEAWGWDHCCR